MVVVVVITNQHVRFVVRLVIQLSSVTIDLILAFKNHNQAMEIKVMELNTMATQMAIITLTQMAIIRLNTTKLMLLLLQKLLVQCYYRAEQFEVQDLLQRERQACCR